MKELIYDLKKNNLKVTPQRLAIYGYLKNTKTHPSADSIYKELKADYPNMSLATVYKNVASLKNAGLVTELNVGEESFRYDGNTKPHAHVVCKCCHKVTDYYGKVTSDSIISNAENDTGYSIDSQQVYFFGLCNDCL